MSLTKTIARLRELEAKARKFSNEEGDRLRWRDYTDALEAAAPALLDAAERAEQLEQAGIDAERGVLVEERDRLAARVAELEAGLAPFAKMADGWQPIETAPRDGTDFLAYESDNMYRASVHHGHFMTRCGQPVVYRPEPTHWMPLPAPPDGGTP